MVWYGFRNQRTDRFRRSDPSPRRLPAAGVPQSRDVSQTGTRLLPQGGAGACPRFHPAPGAYPRGAYGRPRIQMPWGVRLM